MSEPNEITIYFDDREPPVTCHSLEELDAALDKLHRQAISTQPPLAIAIKVFGHEIDMGLGMDPTFLCLQYEPCDGEFYIAVGSQEDSESDSDVMFYGAGGDSYWRPKNLIPLESARSAARYFIEHQARSPLLRWQDWEDRDV